MILRFSLHTAKLLLEFLGVLMAAAAILLGLLFWRISSGPVQISWATLWIEDALNQVSSEIQADIATTQLIWDGEEKSLFLQAQNVTLHDRSGAVLTHIPHLDVNLAPLPLFFGQIRLDRLAIQALELTLHRDSEGRLSLSLVNRPDRPEQAPDSLNLEPVLDFLRGDGTQTSLTSLRRLTIREAQLTFVDDQHDLIRSGITANLTLTRPDDEDEALLTAELQLALPLAESILNISGGFTLPRVGGTYPAELRFADLHPDELAQFHPVFEPLTLLDTAIEGVVAVVFDASPEILGLAANIRGKAGSLTLPQDFAAPLAFRQFETGLAYDAFSGRWALNDIQLDLGDMQIAGGLGLIPDPARPDDWQMTSSFTLRDLHIEKLPHYWPTGMFPPARVWAAENLSQGQVRTAHLSASGHVSRASPPQIDLNLEQLEGAIYYDGLTVNWLDDTPKIRDVSGRADFTKRSFVIRPDSGRLQDIDLSDGQIAFLGLDATDDQPYQSDIRLSLSGSIATAMAVLGEPPLDLFRTIDLPVQDLDGQFSGDLHLLIPLEAGVTLEDIELDAKIQMRDVAHPALFQDFGFTQGVFDLETTHKHLTLTGHALMEDMQVQATWREHFALTAPETYSRRLQLTLPLDGKTRARLGFDLAPYLTGRSPTKLDWRKMRDDLALLDVEIDLSPATISLPLLDYKATPTRGSAAQFRMIFDGSKPPVVENITLFAPDLTLRGHLLFAHKAGRPGWRVSALELPTLRMGDNDLALSLRAMPRSAALPTAQPLKAGFWNSAFLPPDQDYHLTLSGARLDLRPLQKSPEKPPDTPSPLMPPFGLKIQADLEHLDLPHDRLLTDVQLKADYQPGWWNSIEASAQSRAGDNIIHFLPQQDGSHHFDAYFTNIAPALVLIGREPNISGGPLSLSGRSIRTAPPLELTGRITVGAHHIEDVPLMARLLNAVSVIGLREAVRGSRIRFDRMEGHFIWSDGRITLRDGRFAGPSIGLTYEGVIDQQQDRLEIDGTIVPIYTLNRMISAIPLVGSFLGGRDGDLFAVSYRARGAIDEPEITVNPLSTLTPGFVRRLFFVDDSGGAQ